MTRALIIDDNTRALVKRVVDYADAHHYHIGDPVPGDNPHFLAQLNTYRCIFTYTEADGVLWRHLSVSVPSENYPNPIAVFEIATLFGFTGWNAIEHGTNPPDDWQGGIQDDHHCVVMLQPVERLQEKTDA